jgi:hypothetical protein
MSASGEETPHPGAALADRVLRMEPAEGIPTWMILLMEAAEIDHFAGVSPGTYAARPEATYRRLQESVGTCFLDQYIPRNPLSMTDRGYDGSAARRATTGAERIELDGLLIDGPEAVAEHLERFVLPALEAEIARGEAADAGLAEALLAREAEVQAALGPAILKVPYGVAGFPRLRYGAYGYANYFMAYALYPELMERDFRLQGERHRLRNRQVARFYARTGQPPVLRLDHDMADSRGTLVDIRSLEAVWFPAFARAIEPLVAAGVRCLWHCDGNLMAMLPPLIEAGVGGFQGFQIEHGMDYPAICAMTDRDGGPLQIWAGVSVTRALPRGTPAQVRGELAWLVENGPPVGLCLGASSSVTPGVPRANLEAFFEGLAWYRTHGRSGA